MPAVGRPRALTPVKRAELCSLVSSGIDLEEAVGYVGCSTRTVRRETERNEEFRRALTEAQLFSGLDPVHFMRKAAQQDWRAAAWLLERLDPNQFLRRDRSACTPEELTIVIDRVVEAALQQIDDQETRSRVYRHATSVASCALDELFPATAKSGAPRLKLQMQPLSEREALNEMLSEMGRSSKAPPRRDMAAPLDKAPLRADETPSPPAKTAASADNTPAPVAKTSPEHRVGAAA
jgi:hypothetical protein